MIVLDTNVASALMSTRPVGSVIDWVNRQALPSLLYLTTISEAELRYGAEILPVGLRRESLLAEIEDMLREDFAGRILPFNREAARLYATIAASRRASGRPISQADCQIASIARSRGAAVATRDVTGFQGCGIDYQPLVTVTPIAHPFVRRRPVSRVFSKARPHPFEKSFRAGPSPLPPGEGGTKRSRQGRGGSRLWC